MVQNLVYAEHEGARRFLAFAQATLEREESQNGLMLGVALRLVSEPRVYGGDPYLATIESASGLLAAAVMTPPHPLQLFAKDDRDSEALERVARGLLQGKWPVPAVLAREPLAEAFAATWKEKTGADWRTGMRQTVYELRRVVHPPYPPGEFRPAFPEDLELVRRWARGFHEDCFGAGQHERPVANVEEKVRKGKGSSSSGPTTCPGRWRRGPGPRGTARRWASSTRPRARGGRATARPWSRACRSESWTTGRSSARSSRTRPTRGQTGSTRGSAIEPSYA